MIFILIMLLDFLKIIIKNHLIIFLIIAILSVIIFKMLILYVKLQLWFLKINSIFHMYEFHLTILM